MINAPVPDHGPHPRQPLRTAAFHAGAAQLRDPAFVAGLEAGTSWWSSLAPLTKPERRQVQGDLLRLARIQAGQEP